MKIKTKSINRIALPAVLSLTLLLACGEKKPAVKSLVATGPTTDTRMEVSSGGSALAPVLRINQYQSWQLAVTNLDSAFEHPLVIQVDGGMPGHGHGLVSNPQVSRYLGDGKYLLEGVRFNMAGVWQMNFTLKSGLYSETLSMEFDVSH